MDYLSHDCILCSQYMFHISLHEQINLLPRLLNISQVTEAMHLRRGAILNARFIAHLLLSRPEK